MVRGPMRSWIHRHEYRAIGPSTTEVSDRIWFQPPRGPRGILTRLMFSPFALDVLFPSGLSPPVAPSGRVAERRRVYTIGDGDY